MHAKHLTDFHIIALDLGFARFDTCAAIEPDLDDRPETYIVGVDHPCANQDGHDRDDPDSRKSSPATDVRLGAFHGHNVDVIRLVAHGAPSLATDRQISRGSNAIAANIVVATIAAKASAAAPGNIVMMLPS